MRLQIEVKKLDPELLVVVGSAGRTVLVCVRHLQRKRDGHGSQREDARLCAQDKLIQHQVHDKEQRIEKIDRRIQFHSLVKGEWWLYRLEQVRMFAACQLPKTFAILPHTGDQLFFGKSCQMPNVRMPHSEKVSVCASVRSSTVNGRPDKASASSLRRNDLNG